MAYARFTSCILVCHCERSVANPRISSAGVLRLFASFLGNTKKGRILYAPEQLTRTINLREIDDFF